MMVALASSGVRLMPSIPEHDGAGHDENEEAPDVGDDAGHGRDPGARTRGTGAVGRLIGHTLEHAPDEPAPEPGHDQRDQNDDQDAERDARSRSVTVDAVSG